MKYTVVFVERQGTAKEEGKETKEETGPGETQNLAADEARYLGRIRTFLPDLPISVEKILYKLFSYR